MAICPYVQYQYNFLILNNFNKKPIKIEQKHDNCREMETLNNYYYIKYNLN